MHIYVSVTLWASDLLLCCAAVALGWIKRTPRKNRTDQQGRDKLLKIVFSIRVANGKYAVVRGVDPMHLSESRAIDIQSALRTQHVADT